MKKQLLFILMMFFLFHFQQDILARKIKLIKQDIYVGIELDKIKKVDFDSEDAIYEFVKEILPKKLKPWKRAGLRGAAIIFIKHQFNQKNLELKDAFKVRETKILRLAESIKILEKEVEALEALDMENQDIFRRRVLKTEINTLKREQFQLKYWFFEKEKDFDSYVLHKEKKEWTSYLFGTRKFLIVLLGIHKDLTTAGMGVEGKDSFLRQSFFNLDQRISSKGSYTVEEEVEEEPGLKAANQFICRFVELNPKAVRPPCRISITANSDNDDRETFDFDVVERNVLQFKIGLAALVLRKLKYTYEENHFTAEIDEEDEFKLKENLFFMLDIHQARDMDEFHPRFYEPWKNFGKRWGFSLGLKLSSDPFKAILIGLSFALTRDISLVGGISFYEEIRPSSIEMKWYDLDYAMKFLEREYNAKLFWGLSFSPSLIPRLLGISL
ncbi:MAG: hypothetical protein JSV88_06725 [Candidatus Aminicenantes bacterium]|nr:MAG: hypothetical protein JSV88_06725 [Candidatus Aminicenantes bacterium]